MACYDNIPALTMQPREDCQVSTTTSSGEVVAFWGFFGSHEFSNFMLARLEAGYTQEIRNYERNRFVLVATNQSC